MEEVRGRRGSPMKRIFETEEEFVAATSPKGSRGFVVSKGGKTYYVYAVTKEHAMGLVARHLGMLDCATYVRSRQVRSISEAEVLSLFGGLSEELKAKIRKTITRK